MLQYFLYKRENELWMADDPVMEVFLALTRFHRVLGLGGDEFVHLARPQPRRDEELKIFCRDASRFLGEILDESAGASRCPPPWSPSSSTGTCWASTTTAPTNSSCRRPFPPRTAWSWSIARRRHHLAPAGRPLRRRRHLDRPAGPPGPQRRWCSFPSYVFLRGVTTGCQPTPTPCSPSGPGATDDDQREVLEALAGRRAPTCCSPCSAASSPRASTTRARCCPRSWWSPPACPSVQHRTGAAQGVLPGDLRPRLLYAYLIPGLTRVVQAAGRLIRSDTDRGVIVLIGRRFQDSRYARYLPGSGPAVIRVDVVRRSGVRRQKFFDE